MAVVWNDGAVMEMVLCQIEGKNTWKMQFKLDDEYLCKYDCR